MAIFLFFGLPGCGKTTLLSYFACKFTNQNSLYENVYGNVHLSVPDYIYIDNDCIGKFQLHNCAILIDEATIFADSRRHKEFPKYLVEFFLLHRHYKCDIYLFSQGWDAVDRRIRIITDRVYYVYKGLFTGKWFTKFYRIPYGIIIPDPKKNGGSEKLGEIIQGYCKPPLLVRALSSMVFRPKYYKYFDSWEAPELPPLPECYTPYGYLPSTSTQDIEDQNSSVDQSVYDAFSVLE